MDDVPFTKHQFIPTSLTRFHLYSEAGRPWLNSVLFNSTTSRRATLGTKWTQLMWWLWSWEKTDTENTSKALLDSLPNSYLTAQFCLKYKLVPWNNGLEQWNTLTPSPFNTLELWNSATIPGSQLLFFPHKELLQQTATKSDTCTAASESLR